MARINASMLDQCKDFISAAELLLGEELDAHLKRHRQRRRASVGSGDLDMVVWLEIYRARIRWGELLAQRFVWSRCQQQ